MGKYTDSLVIYKRRPHYGFYVYSSPGCGEESAIRFSHVEFDKRTFEVNMSPKEAIKLAKCIIKVAKDYEKGIATGLHGEGVLAEKE
jgi:hypothetical protein